MALKKDLIELLNKTQGERKIHAFLKKEPLLVWATFMTCGGHADYVIPEFRFRDKFRADFVVMQSFSGGWNISFVELEPVDKSPFYKKGGKLHKHKRLDSAIKQISDWRNFVAHEGATLRAQLADVAQKRDLLYPERNLAREPRCVKMPLRDPRTYLCCKYFIVVGRRHHLLNDEIIYEKSNFSRSYSNTEILTYDRFADVAKKLERQDERYKERVILEEDKIFLTEFYQNQDKFIKNKSFTLNNCPTKIDIHGIAYDIWPNEREEGFVVEVIGTIYEIFEDRRTFKLYRIESDGLALFVANNLESMSATIQLAEIFERFFYFYLDTKHSFDILEECLQFLRENPPYRIGLSDVKPK